ncbi:unnamed protein product [Ixodes hexagonus]
MAAAPTTSPVQQAPVQQAPNELATANAVSGDTATEPSHDAPKKKATSKVNQDAMPDQDREAPSTPAEATQQEDTVAAKDEEHSNVMDVQTGTAKRRLEDTASGAGESQLRRLEREWCGKVGRFKSQSAPQARNKETQ